MGYISRISGGWTISPPLAWYQFKDVNVDAGYGIFAWKVREQVKDTDEGPLTVRVAVGVEVEVDEGKLYATEEELKAYLAAIQAARTLDGLPLGVDGEFVQIGEEAGDIERYLVRDGKLVREKAVTSWPDGSPVKL